MVGYRRDFPHVRVLKLLNSLQLAGARLKTIGLLTTLLTALLFGAALPTWAAGEWPLFEAGQDAYTKQDYKKAVEYFTKSIAAENDALEVTYVNRAFAYHELGETQKAIDDCTKAIEIKSDYALAYISRANNYLALDNADKAMNDCERAIIYAPNNEEAYYQRGLCFKAKGSYNKAIDDFNKAIELKPDYSQAFFDRAASRQNLGQFNEQTFADWNKYIELNPTISQGYTERGTAYMFAQEYNKAIPDLTKAIALNAQDSRAYLGLGSCYELLKQLDKAMAEYEKGIAISPNDEELLGAKASVLCKKGNFQQAISICDKLKGSYPNEIKGFAYLGLKNPDKAIEIFKGIQNDDPARTLFGLSVAYKMKGDMSNASDYKSKSIECPTFKAYSDDLGAFEELLLGVRTVITGKNGPVRDKWALVIGISKFANPAYNLQYAAKDAQDFYNYLVNEANFKKDHVLLLLNENATRENVMDAFGDRFLPSVTQEGDMVVVFVSTHGTPARKDKGGRNYIVAYDTDGGRLYGTGVDMDELYRRIKEGVKTERALIVMDTCYSGAGVPGAKGEHAPANFDAEEMAQGCGHLVISSSSPDQRSWESKASQNGVFTKYLLETLRSRGGKIDIKTAFADVQKKVGWEVQSAWGEKQTPLLGGKWEGKEMILAVPAIDTRQNLNPELLKLMQAVPVAAQPAKVVVPSRFQPKSPAVRPAVKKH